MDALRERLANLADDAPSGGPPAAELWTRGRRAHRLRSAAAAVTLLVVGVVGAGIGALLATGDEGSDAAPVGTVGFTLPIRYPVGEELPTLGNAPGQLAAVWLVPGLSGGAPQVVGLVAKTGRFGTLPIEVWSEMYFDDPDAYFALSPDGRRIAYHTPAGELVVRDLVSGASYSPAFESFRHRPGYTWVDATHLVGHVQPDADPTSIHQGNEADGWVWEPGTAAPRLVDLMTYPGSPYLWGQAGKDPWFRIDPSDPGGCPGVDTVPVLCDVVGVIGSEVALTHDGDGAVVALDARGVTDPALRHVVASAQGPERVTFATDLIGQALEGAGGAS